MNKGVISSWGLSAISWFTMILSNFDIEYVLTIVSQVVAILSGVASLVVSLIIWYKKATEDGKITTDELEDLKDLVETDEDDNKDE